MKNKDNLRSLSLKVSYPYTLIARKVKVRTSEGLVSYRGRLPNGQKIAGQVKIKDLISITKIGDVYHVTYMKRDKWKYPFRGKPDTIGDLLVYKSGASSLVINKKRLAK